VDWDFATDIDLIPAGPGGEMSGFSPTLNLSLAAVDLADVAECALFVLDNPTGPNLIWYYLEESDDASSWSLVPFDNFSVPYSTDPFSGDSDGIVSQAHSATGAHFHLIQLAAHKRYVRLRQSGIGVTNNVFFAAAIVKRPNRPTDQ